MKAAFGVGVAAAALVGASFATGASAQAPPASKPTHVAPASATERIAGPQHWCSTNGVNCADPNLNWDEYPGYNKLVRKGVRLLPYIGHDEPEVQFYSNRPGSANNVTYRLQLAQGSADAAPAGRQRRQLDLPAAHHLLVRHAAVRRPGLPEPGRRQHQTGHPTIPCKPDSDSNLYASPDPNSPATSGSALARASWRCSSTRPDGRRGRPASSCDATQWCSALNIDTFQDNENTGALNNTDCLNTVGPEPVNFAFLTKDGRATAPGNPQHPEHFVPDCRPRLPDEPR